MKRGVANKDKTHCKNGHEFTPENTYLRERYKGGPMLRVCRECNLLSARRARLKHYYGITPEQYDAMLEAQGGGCAICGAGPGPSGRLLHVDHCHKTKRVRGVLCSRCNTYLGHMNDDPALIRRAADYLEGVCLSTR